MGDRENCFKTTLVHLTERFTGKDVYLVGTMNSSTMLAQRTQKLIQELKPDSVLVQANPAWWASARTLQYVDSQEEFNKYGKDLARYDTFKDIDYYKSNRHWIFLARLYAYIGLFNYHFSFGSEFHFLRPGLEVKYACEAAEQVGAKVQFLGSEMNQDTWKRIYHETRFNCSQYMWRRMKWRDTCYEDELYSNWHKMSTVSPSAFTEKCLDANQMNWFIQATDLFFPRLKEIFIDQRDDDLFKAID